MLERLTIDTFSPLVGDCFTLHLDATRTMQVKLGEVTFSIMFRSASNTVLPQRIYHLEHATLGAFGLFLVTIGPDAAGMRYEAVFT
jgi:hypothetical protein